MFSVEYCKQKQRMLRVEQWKQKTAAHIPATPKNVKFVQINKHIKKKGKQAKECSVIKAD